MIWLMVALSAVLLLLVFLQWVNYRQIQLQLDDFQLAVDDFVHKTIKQQVTLEHMMEAATTSVEDVHKAFTDVSFDILESIPQTQEVGKHMRRLHDQSASGVYGTMRSVGKGISVLRQEMRTLRKQKEQGVLPDNKEEK